MNEMLPFFYSALAGNSLACLRRIWFELGFSQCVSPIFLYKIDHNPREIVCCGQKVAQMPLLTTSFFLGWVG